MTRVLFDKLRSDLPDLLNGGLEDATNCIPYGNSYGPFPEAVPYSASATGRVYGAFSTRDTAGNAYTFVATQGQLYKESATVLNNVSRTASYTTPTDKVFEFVTFGNTTLAVNGTDALQVYTLGTSTQFLDASASASAPVAAHIATVRDFVFMGNLATGNNRVQWSRINNPLRYTPSQQFQSDFQDLPGDNAAIMRITGGDFATILTKSSVWRGSYVGAPLIFRFDELAPGVGCLAGGSCARFQGATYYLSSAGFFVFDGNQSTPIGNEEIDTYFLADVNKSFLHRITSVIDPDNKLYIVSYPSVSSSDGLCDKIAIFGWAVGRWTFVNQSLEWLFINLSGGVTLEGLDAYGNMETLMYSLDADVWQGGQAFLGGIDSSHRITRFTGDDKEARFITGESQIIPDGRAFIRAIRPLVQGTSSTNVTVQIGYRDRLIDPVQWTVASMMNATGLCPVRNNARFQRLRVDIAAGFDRAMGADIDYVAEGFR